jgi:hypothetical protein
MKPLEASANRPQRIADFIARWSPGGAAHALNEEQGAQQHFIELCALPAWRRPAAAIAGVEPRAGRPAAE